MKKVEKAYCNTYAEALKLEAKGFRIVSICYFENSSEPSVSYILERELN